jgi:hypothetical protein
LEENRVCDGGVLLKEVREEFNLNAAIEGFGVDLKEIGPESIESRGIERMELDWKCERGFEGLN